MESRALENIVVQSCMGSRVLEQGCQAEEGSWSVFS